MDIQKFTQNIMLKIKYVSITIIHDIIFCLFIIRNFKHRKTVVKWGITNIETLQKIPVSSFWSWSAGSPLDGSVDIIGIVVSIVSVCMCTESLDGETYKMFSLNNI